MTDKINAVSSYPQRYSGNELYFITSGHLVRNCNINDIRLNKHDFHLSLSRQATSVNDFSPDLTGFYCRFEDSFLEQVYLKDSIENDLEFISSFLYQYPIRLSQEVSERVTYLFKTLLKLSDESPSDQTLPHLYLIAVIYEVKKFMIESGLDFYPSKAFLTTKKYNDSLAVHIDKQRSIDFYAKLLGITPNHLNKSVKAVTGKTAIALLNEMSIQETKIRLKYTNLSISEIAFQLGFEDLSYFSRFFKKSVGISPLQYRKDVQAL